MLKHLDGFLKRALDIAVSLAAIVVLSPVLLVVAVLVKLSSPGPVFYRGARTGRYGAEFHIYKFRSMVVEGERLGGTTTGQDDPRVTRIGRVLRNYKLDELPQFFNVLRGEMSLVGPRPEVAEYTDHYTAEERHILSVKPGITDFASLEFSDLQSWVGASDPDRVFREKVLPRKNALRVKYVQEQSLLCDLRILARTAVVILAKPFRRSSTCKH